MDIFPTKKSDLQKCPVLLTIGHVIPALDSDCRSFSRDITSEAIPAVNCVSSSSINACIEAARKMDAPIMIQSLGSVGWSGMVLNPWRIHQTIAYLPIHEWLICCP